MTMESSLLKLAYFTYSAPPSTKQEIFLILKAIPQRNYLSSSNPSTIKASSKCLIATNDDTKDSLINHRVCLTTTESEIF